MSVRTCLFAFAAVAAAATMTGIAISPANAQDVMTVRVGFADLNLANAAGRATLDRRIDGAARTVCGDVERELRADAARRACRADALAGARAQLARVIVDDQVASIEVSRAAL